MLIGVADLLISNRIAPTGGTTSALPVFPSKLLSGRWATARITVRPLTSEQPTPIPYTDALVEEEPGQQHGRGRDGESIGRVEAGVVVRFTDAPPALHVETREIQPLRMGRRSGRRHDRWRLTIAPVRRVQRSPGVGARVRAPADSDRGRRGVPPRLAPLTVINTDEETGTEPSHLPWQVRL